MHLLNFWKKKTQTQEVSVFWKGKNQNKKKERGKWVYVPPAKYLLVTMVEER